MNPPVINRELIGPSFKIVDTDGQIYSRAQFIQLIDQCKTHLLKRQKPLKKVAIFADNTAQNFALIFALWEIGVCFYGDPLKVRVLDRALNVLHVDAVFADERHFDEAQDFLNGALPVINIFDMFQSDGATDRLQAPQISPDDEILIGFTSGSTERCRTVYHSHRSLLAASGHMSEKFYAPGTPILIYLNLNHLGYISCVLLAAFRSGCEIHLLAEGDISLIARKVQENQIKIVPLFSYNWFEILKICPDICLKNIDLVVTGGDLVSKEFVDTVFSRGAKKIVNVYGMTEALPPVSVKEIVPHDTEDYSGHNLGAPVPYVEIVFDDRGNLLLRGQNQGRIEPGSSITSEGFVRVRDEGYLKNGELFIKHRSKHLVRRGDQEVSLMDIKYILRTFVFNGRPLREWVHGDSLTVMEHDGRLVLAFVPQRKEDFQGFTLSWVNQELEKVFGPQIFMDHLLIRENLPFNGIKIDEPELKKVIEEEAANYV